jgi:Fe2+ transport system protein FeoA
MFAAITELVVYWNYDHYGRSFKTLSYKQYRSSMGVRRLSLLSELNVGESGVLVALDLPESVQNHLMHMGFVPDAQVTVLRRAPAGDPTVYGIDGMEIALRHETAEAIQVRQPETEAAPTPEATGLKAPNSKLSVLIEATR